MWYLNTFTRVYVSQGQYKDTKGVIRSRNSRKAGQYKHIHIIIDTDIHKVCQRLVTGQWFSPGPPVFSTNKSDPHDIAEILLKVALNTIKLTTQLTDIRIMVATLNLNTFEVMTSTNPLGTTLFSQ